MPPPSGPPPHRGGAPPPSSSSSSWAVAPRPSTTTSPPPSAIEAQVCRKLQTTLEAAGRYLERVREVDKFVRGRSLDALRQASSEADRRKLRCSGCGNTDEAHFDLSDREGSLVCTLCGVQAAQSMMRDADWVRTFEGDVDEKTHGMEPDTRFGSAYNLKTSFSEADKPTKGGSRTASKELALVQGQIELQLSQFGKTEKHTRQGYKDQEKRKYFELLDEVRNVFMLGERVVRRAQTLFAHVRDETETLREPEAHVAACLVLALREAREQEGGGGRKRVHADAPPVAVKTGRFVCPKCSVSFGDRKSLTFHTC